MSFGVYVGVQGSWISGLAVRIYGPVQVISLGFVEFGVQGLCASIVVLCDLSVLLKV